MYYPDMIEYITFLFFMLDEFSTTPEPFNCRFFEHFCEGIAS